MLLDTNNDKMEGICLAVADVEAKMQIIPTLQQEVQSASKKQICTTKL